MRSQIKWGTKFQGGPNFTQISYFMQVHSLKVLICKGIIYPKGGLLTRSRRYKYARFTIFWSK